MGLYLIQYRHSAMLTCCYQSTHYEMARYVCVCERGKFGSGAFTSTYLIQSYARPKICIYLRLLWRRTFLIYPINQLALT